jgi:NAD(P)H-flavin reductase
VTSYRLLTPTVFELGFETEIPLHFDAGQFISIVIPGAGPNGRDLRRAYSIASAPEKRPIELCVKLVEDGPGTNYLNKLRPGDKFRGFAPYGDFVYEPKENRHVIFIATGTGIAPFRAMLQSAKYKAHPPTSLICLLGVRSEEELLYTHDFSSEELKWVPTVSQPKTSEYSGFKGRVTDYMRSLHEAHPWQDTEYYMCGNGDMIKEMKAFLAEKGVLPDSIHQEKYY